MANFRESQESVVPTAPPKYWSGRRGYQGAAGFNNEPPRYQSLTIEDSDYHRRGPRDTSSPMTRRNTLNRSLAFAGKKSYLYAYVPGVNVLLFALTRNFDWSFLWCS